MTKSSYSKEKMKEYNKKYYQNNKQKRKDYVKKYREIKKLKKFEFKRIIYI